MSSASTPKAYFEDFFRDRPDAWSLDSSWYERRKREILLSTLPTPRLGRVLEIGCMYGAVTERLRERADHVLAFDISEVAIARAAERVGDDPRVTLLRATLPQEWPDGEFDTVVASEVLYYLSAPDMTETVDRSVGALVDGGVLVACHFRPENPRTEAPITGEYVHEVIRARPELERTVEHLETQFRIEVFRRRPRDAA